MRNVLGNPRNRLGGSKLMCWGCGLLSLLLCMQASGQVRLFFITPGTNPLTYPPNTDVSVTINAGQSVTFEVFIDDTGTNLKGWQITMPCAASGGVLGSLDFTPPAVIDLAHINLFPPNIGVDWVYSGLTALTAVDPGQCNDNIPCTMTPQCPAGSTCTAGFCTTANPRATGAVFTNGPVVSIPKYLSTWTYQSSPNASGMFTLDLITNNIETFLRDPAQLDIPITIFDGAVINVKCTSNATCDDGNACTTDSCNIGSGICTNTNNTPMGQCCNPSNGTLTPIDDGNSCTTDACNAMTGMVTHTALPNGSACGNPASTQCDQPDTCQAGTCQANLRPPGFACGNGTPTHPECDQPDACDGAGMCLANSSPPGTMCGDPTDTDCTDPDICNGVGQCVNNDVANGTPCSDGLNCNVGETCTAGMCGGGGPLDCDDGNQCTADMCVEGPDPMTVCQSTNTMDVCDDGNPCTGTGAPGIGMDMCDGMGSCIGLPDPNCNLQCSTAVPVVEGTNSGFSNTSASEPDDAEASCQANSNGDVWFKYTASCSLEILVTLAGSVFAPSNDTVLSIYDACGGNEIACDDDGAAGLLSAVTFNAMAGVEYRIRVAGFGANTGSITITIQPANTDGCLIDGACFLAGDLNPMNACLVCTPGATTTAWTARQKGSACGSPTFGECDSADACDGAGTCEANNKPDGIPCSDDGAQCTFDLCSVGICSHPPRPNGTICGDPTDTECDNPDSCDGLGACDPRFETMGTPCGDPMVNQCDNADTCTGGGACAVNFVMDGTACDDLDICTELDACLTGLCVGDFIPEAPIGATGGPRTIVVTPQPPAGVAPVALLVTGDPMNPRVSCVSAYVQADGSLGPMPVFQTPAMWGTVNITGGEIIPSTFDFMTMMLIPTTYFVVEECGTGQSSAAQVNTARWGDVDVDGDVDIDDILCVLAGFSGSFVNCTKPNVDLKPCGGANGVIDIDDILAILGAFSGAPFPCVDPCP